MFVILILFILFGEIESLWSSDCIQKLTDNIIIKCNSGPHITSSIDAKTCDGHNDCADSSDESPTFCGTGCQKVFRKSKKIINCGSKNISLTNAVNVDSEFDFNAGSGIYVTDNFTKCNGRHVCDLTFTMLNYDYVIVAFQCIEPRSITTKDNKISKDNINNVKVIVAGFVCCGFVIAIVIICLLVRRHIARRQTNNVNVIDANRNNRPDGTDVISNNRSLQTSNTNNRSIQTSNTNNRSIQTSNTNNRSIQTSNTGPFSALNEVARNVLIERHIQDITNLDNNNLIGNYPYNRVMFVRSPSEISSHMPDSRSQTRHGLTVYDLE